MCQFHAKHSSFFPPLKSPPRKNKKTEEIGKINKQNSGIKKWERGGGGGQKPLAFGSSYQNMEHFMGLAGF